MRCADNFSIVFERPIVITRDTCLALIFLLFLLNSLNMRITMYHYLTSLHKK